MGFLSSLTSSIGKILRPIGSLLGITPPAPVARQVMPPVVGALPGAVAMPTRGFSGMGARAGALRRGVPIAGAGVAGVGAGLAAASMIDPETGQPLMGGGGNGRYTTYTTVTTIDNATGETVRQKMYRGSPYLMNRDLVAAKKVMRTAGKLGRRFGSRVRTPSKAKQLTDAVVDRAMQNVIAPQARIPHHAH